ncbi:MAG: calcineurin-like phosphoesterase C-terminal domain-containing protein [Gemmatimonadaceae bacterium]|nr:calcineurin-like phosphoesterase C-terminal domain-containing protein [Gemmatimonadaceae bacterium]
MHRRDFLRRSGITFGALAVPDQLLRDPYAPLVSAPSASPPIRVRGRVSGDGRGLPRVRVSDGRTVVLTDSDGQYTHVGDPSQPFVFVSTPAGWQPARNQTGTTRFYHPLDPTVSEQTAHFALTTRAGDAKHSLLVLADPQTENRRETDLLHAETVPDVLKTTLALGDRAVLGVACGDIMFDDLSLYPEWERAVQRMGVPFYQVIGNHDLDFASRTAEGASATYRRHFGPTAYSFDVGLIHYVVLDNVFWHGDGYIGYIDATQLAWMTADLATLERGSTVVVLQHIPALSSYDARASNARKPSAGNSTMNRQALYRLLEPYRAFIVSGHQHELEHVHEGGPTHVVSGAVCGAWWSGPICNDGTPNGYLVLNGDDSSVTWRYQSTGFAPSHQMRVYKRGADPTAPSDVIANVWAWDESWRVTWFEDGQPRGLMSRRQGRDPLSVQLHDGPNKPALRTWVEPVPTTHLFYANPSATAKEVIIEATDGMGQVYRERHTMG